MFVPAQQGHQLRRRRRAEVGDDIRPLAQTAAEGKNAAGRADGVRVCIPVAHHENAAGLGNQGAHRGGHDPGLDLAAALGLGGPAAVEGEVEPVLDDRLIAAAGQRHLQGQGGEIIVLLEAGAVLAHAEGKGGRDAVGVRHLPDRFQQGEFALRDAEQVLCLKNEQEAVAFQPSQQASDVLRPAADAAVEGGVQIGDRRVVEVVGQLVVVVDQNDGNHRPGAEIFVSGVQKLGGIHPLQQGDFLLIRALLRLVAETAPAAVADDLIVRSLQLARADPVQLRAG